MALLKNAVWLSGTGGVAKNGSTTVSQNGVSTTVTGSFTTNAWTVTQSGQTVVSEAGAPRAEPVNANYQFSTPVRSLTFGLMQSKDVDSTGAADVWTLVVFDDLGALIPVADILDGLKGLDSDHVRANADGSVTLHAQDAQDMTLSLAGQISELDLTVQPGAHGASVCGAGMSDLTFDIPTQTVEAEPENDAGPVVVTELDTVAMAPDLTPARAEGGNCDRLPCFTPGTMIVTSSGEQAVETLLPGDLVLTRDSGFQPVRWIGAQTIGKDALAAQPELRPILIPPQAMGNKRAMRLSPEHGVVLRRGGDEKLIRAKHIASTLGAFCAQVDHSCQDVRYIHLMFDQHQLVFAEGIAVETVYPGSLPSGGADGPSRRDMLSVFPAFQNADAVRQGVAHHYGQPVRQYLSAKDFVAGDAIKAA